MKQFYYVYIITYTNNKKYIGYRGCNISPYEDTKYLGSGVYTPKNKDLIISKNILYIFLNAELAYSMETYLLKSVDAKNNPVYYNKHNNEGLKHLEWTIERKQKISKILKKTFKKPEIKIHRSKLSNERWSNPDMVKKIMLGRENFKNSKKYKEYIEIHRNNSIKMWEDLDYREKMNGVVAGKNNGRYDHFWYVLQNENTYITIVMQRYHGRCFSKDWLDMGKSKCFKLLNKHEKSFKGWELKKLEYVINAEGPYCILHIK